MITEINNVECKLARHVVSIIYESYSKHDGKKSPFRTSHYRLLFFIEYRLYPFVFIVNDVVIVEKIKDNRTPFYRPRPTQQESDSLHPGILTLMKQCWAEEPSERPSFDEVANSLKVMNKGRWVVRDLFFLRHSCKPSWSSLNKAISFEPAAFLI